MSASKFSVGQVADGWEVVLEKDGIIVFVQLEPELDLARATLKEFYLQGVSTGPMGIDYGSAELVPEQMKRINAKNYAQISAWDGKTRLEFETSSQKKYALYYAVARPVVLRAVLSWEKISSR